MPPRAAWKRPGRSLRASVKEPLRWPNSSLSKVASGSAPMSTARKVPAARADAAWIARATSSLPTPFSPSTMTLAWVGATAAIIAFSSRIGADSPISGEPSDRRAAASTVLAATAASTAAASRSLSQGLVMKSRAPRFRASTASGTSA